MKEYTIKKGASDWNPREWPAIFRKFQTIKISCIPTESMEFDYGSDQDWKDWKKIGGISFATVWTWWKLFIHNIDAIHFGWRWNSEIKKHEFCLYINKDKTHTAFQNPDQIVQVNSGDTVVMEIIKLRKSLYEVNLFDRYGDALIKKFSVPIDFIPDFYASSGLWYGGKNNSPGDFGGRAPQDMSIFKTYSIVKTLNDNDNNNQQ